jgi:hypothetical protein
MNIARSIATLCGATAFLATLGSASATPLILDFNDPAVTVVGNPNDLDAPTQASLDAYNLAKLNGDPLPKLDGAETTLTLHVAAIGVVDGLSVHVAIAGSFADELTLWLTHNGIVQVLRTGGGSTPNLGFDVTFTDDASKATATLPGKLDPAAGNVVNSTAHGDLVTGFFLPEDSLALAAGTDFLGQDMSGDWTLSIFDAVFAGDCSVIQDGCAALVTSNANLPDPAAVPEPASVILLGGSLAGLALLSRRRATPIRTRGWFRLH